MNHCPRATACHEAGHALAFWWNARHIERISVRTRAQARSGPMVDLRGNLHAVEGLIEADYFVLRPAAEVPGVGEYLPSMVEAIERDLLNCFAGPVAEAIYRHARTERLLKGSGLGDLRRAQELICLLPPRKLLDAERRAIARAHRLVHRYWSTVMALATMLQLQGTVEGSLVSRVLADLSGESAQPQAHDLSSLDHRQLRPGLTPDWPPGPVPARWQ